MINSRPLKSGSLILLAGLIVFASCGKKEEETPKATAPSLDGTWTAGCHLDDEDKYQTISVTISGTEFTQTTVAYDTDSTCATKSYTFTSTSTLSVGAATTTPADSYALNLTSVTLTVTPHGASNTTAFNAGSVCGITSWVADTASSVLGKTCDSGTGALPNAGDIQYTVYKVDGTKLYLGKDSGSNKGKEEATRHSELETTALTKS